MMRMSKDRRYFVGIGFDRDVKSEISSRLKISVQSGRVMPDYNYHITIYYIGVADDERISEYDLILKDFSEELTSFELKIEGVSEFVKRKGRIIYLNASDLGQMEKIARKLNGDTPFIPHLTIAKEVKGGCSASFTPISVKVRELTLFESIRIDGILRYVPVKRYELRE